MKTSNPKNGNTIPDGEVIKTTVCIVGSGPAGITAALQLNKAGIPVLLMEGARPVDMTPSDYFINSWNDKELLYAGTASGLLDNREPHFLIRPYWTEPETKSTPPWERERVFGGTSTHWGRECRPLAPVVFEGRPGFPSWPITREELDPYYSEASSLLGLEGDYYSDNNIAAYNFTTAFCAEKYGVQLNDIVELPNFNIDMYQFAPENRKNFATSEFGGEGTAVDQGVQVILNATLLNIEKTNGTNNNRVTGLHFGTMTDTSPPTKATQFTVQADFYILACGAVANARMLLASDVGNENNLVGRYFMCQPDTGLINPIIFTQGNPTFLSGPTNKLMGSNTPYSNGGSAQGKYVLSDDIAKEHGIGRCWFRSGSNYPLYFEQSPSADSRITLIGPDQVDPVFGIPKVNINWSFGEVDQQTFEVNIQLFNESLAQHYPDQDVSISSRSWEEAMTLWAVNGHHIGTTRMSNLPTEGVVDENLKVHSLDNLYVAGSSVFPTAGLANPTMTIIALSARLADHLEQAITSRGKHLDRSE